MRVKSRKPRRIRIKFTVNYRAFFFWNLRRSHFNLYLKGKNGAWRIARKSSRDHGYHASTYQSSVEGSNEADGKSAPQYWYLEYLRPTFSYNIRETSRSTIFKHFRWNLKYFPRVLTKADGNTYIILLDQLLSTLLVNSTKVLTCWDCNWCCIYSHCSIALLHRKQKLNLLLILKWKFYLPFQSRANSVLR